MKFYQRLILIILTFIFLTFLYAHFYRHLKKAHINLKLPSDAKIDKNLIFTRQSKKCIDTYLMKDQDSNTFQKVDESIPPELSQLYVYSAFYDTRSKGKVKVISVLKGYSNDLQCIIWFSSNSSRKVKATVSHIPEGNGRLYTASFIICPLESNVRPMYVSIISKSCAPILNLIKINHIPKTVQSSKIAVCVTPLNLAYNKVDQFIETVSINEMLGASHIYLYNYTTGLNIEKILRFYIDRGTVTVLPFHLPMKVHIWPLPSGYMEEVKYFGQMAALNDCLYRTMGHFGHVAFSDLDEYLVPRRHRSWRQLMASELASSVGWLFRNSFFKIEWPSDPVAAANRTIADLHAMSLLKTRRTRTIDAPFLRSKMLLAPLAIDVIGVHSVWAFHENEGGRNLVVLGPADGLCHHYRFWDGIGEVDFVEDRGILRLQEDIIAAVSRNRALLAGLI